MPVRRVLLWECLEALVDGRVVSAILVVGSNEVEEDALLASDDVETVMSELRGVVSDDDDEIAIVAAAEVGEAAANELLANAAAGLDCARWVNFRSGRQRGFMTYGQNVRV